MMYMLSYVWRWLTRDIRKTVEYLQDEVDCNVKDMAELRGILSDCEKDNLKKDIIIERQEMSRRAQENMQDEEERWNSKYSHNPIRYKAQGEHYRDMRSLINYPSYIASEVVLFDGLNKTTEEETLFAILKWCDDNIRYVRDLDTNGVPEHWEDSDITLQRKTGDCDSKALVFKALCLVCGIPDYRVKVVAGDVEDPADKERTVGHAYPIVLIKGEWYTFDPTYHPDYTPIKSRIKHRNSKRYKGIWWTFTKTHCFSQRMVTI